ncbi:hypothetical protein HanHA300_Chr14g0513311 [Helianthus annuus]|nr:hypothetical protein HanHA300_Chr14g0513311 [Helianthus annuus]KAJ0484612.1 hypothetical protein HanHA89_Chr14g0558801 [Helianthus annuus]KAJ0655164.1 hypothetical protein HanLR1_Chr14g0521081 [Helianthus annuus]
MLSSQPVFFRDSSQLGFFSFTLSSSSFPPFITLLVKLFSPTNSGTKSFMGYRLLEKCLIYFIFFSSY